MVVTSQRTWHVSLTFDTSGGHCTTKPLSLLSIFEWEISELLLIIDSLCQLTIKRLSLQRHWCHPRSLYPPLGKADQEAYHRKGQKSLSHLRQTWSKSNNVKTNYQGGNVHWTTFWTDIAAFQLSFFFFFKRTSTVKVGGKDASSISILFNSSSV